MSKKTIGIYVFYFGKWPEWINLYIETLKRNSTIDFHIFTDCDTSGLLASNIFFHKYSFEEYVGHVSKKLGIDFKPSNGIKICDLRPFIGYVHQDIFSKYDFYGWADSDLLFGDIRTFVTDDILEKYHIFSTHEIRIAGHFSIFKNTSRNRMMCKKIYNWKEALLSDKFIGIDEHGITNAYKMTIFDKFNEKFKLSIDNFVTRFFSHKKLKRMYMKEQYTTPFTSIAWIDGSLDSMQPDVWFYKDGNITNIRDGKRTFIYLHFMNFKSSLWRHDKTKAPWEGKEKVCFASISDMKNGIKICNEGILPSN